MPAVGPSQLGGDFALPAMSVPKAMDLEDIERVTQDWVDRGRTGQAGRFRHRLRLRRPHVSTRPVLVAFLQQAQRRVRRLVGESCSALARDARAGQNGRGPGATARLPSVCRLTRRAVPAWPSTTLSDSWRWRTSSSTCATCRSVELPNGQRILLYRLLQGGLPVRVDSSPPREHEQANRGCRAARESGSDGRHLGERLSGHHRSSPAVDRRSLSPEQDRGRPLRRDSRSEQVATPAPVGLRGVATSAALRMQPLEKSTEGVGTRRSSREPRRGTRTY